MAKLLVTSDLHGSINAWTMVKKLLEPNDCLAIAGDLFDTRYGSADKPDFQPGTIKQELLALDNLFYYVYGNCDVNTFFPGHQDFLNFEFQGIRIFLHHGHIFSPPIPGRTQVIIQGHTHMAVLKKEQEKILLNPGSPALPRKNRLYTCGIIENQSVMLLDLETNSVLRTLGI